MNKLRAAPLLRAPASLFILLSDHGKNLFKALHEVSGIILYLS